MNINLFMDFEKEDAVEEINTYVSASSPTISAKKKKIIDEYPAGSTWTKTYGPAGDSECKGFAQMIYKKISVLNNMIRFIIGPLYRKLMLKR